METYLLSLPITPVGIGERLKQLPLHCTVFQYFSTDAPFTTLRRELGKICKLIHPIELVGGDSAMFGRFVDVQVNLVEETPGLRELHSAVGALLKELGATIHDPNWAGDGYRPHVTVVNGRAFEPGQRVAVNRIMLVQKLADNRKLIAAQFPLG